MFLSVFMSQSREEENEPLFNRNFLQNCTFYSSVNYFLLFYSLWDLISSHKGNPDEQNMKDINLELFVSLQRLNRFLSVQPRFRPKKYYKFHRTLIRREDKRQSEKIITTALISHERQALDFWLTIHINQEDFLVLAVLDF